MRKFIGTLTVLALVLALVGYWRGWFKMTTTSDEDSKTKIELTIDRDAVKSDTSKLKGEVRDISKRIANGIDDQESSGVDTTGGDSKGDDGQVLPPRL